VKGQRRTFDRRTIPTSDQREVLNMHGEDIGVIWRLECTEEINIPCTTNCMPKVHNLQNSLSFRLAVPS